MKILADATLPNLSTLFSAAFNITLYNTPNELPSLLRNHDILLCRASLKVTENLLAGTPIQCIATASSGIDHIDINYLKKQGIHLFDAKGANAPAVADYVLATLGYLYRNKLLIGNKAGVIGVGEVGSRVVTRLQALGFDVICYDPLKALFDKNHRYSSLEELATCHLLCVHANLHEKPHYPSANLLSEDFFTQLKSRSAIINAARGGIIKEEALITANKSFIYCTDVYQGEPEVSAKIIDYSTLCTPHIAGHSIEAKNAAIIRVSEQLHRHYGLPFPTPLSQTIPTALALPMTPSGTLWFDYVLAMYDPSQDTEILKSALDKKSAFLAQREAHQNRHDFSCYDLLSTCHELVF